MNCFGKLLIILSATTIYIPLSYAQNKSIDTGEPFVVVELFGSEGCSSCPPADLLLSELTQVARNQQKRIFTLDFHVDYWDYLGWKDPFSKKEFTDRQQRYAQELKSNSIYTPQMIINGQTSFVGSDKERAKQEIDKALTLPALAKINLEVNYGTQEISLGYSIEGAPKGSIMNAALVERGLVSEALRGENAGRTLKHDNVVRQFKSISLLF